VVVKVEKNYEDIVIFEEEADVYVRVSSDDQQERETIENQIEFATKYCDLHKIRIREWYKDDGITGTIPLEDRPDGNRLINDANDGKSSKLVLIFNMKRLGRKARVTLDAIDRLEKSGVVIRSMTEPFDTGTPVGRFIITVLAGQAELDRDTTLEVMWHGANRAARKGKWLGGIIPYGYRVNNDRYLEINEDPFSDKLDLSEANVIRLMYNLISNQGMTTVKIADYFNALTIPPSYIKDGRKVKKGKRKENTAGVWTPGRIGNMIKNQTYKGIHIYGKRSTKDRELIERQVPAIVSEELWDRAQIILKNNQLESVKNSKRNFLLRGLIKCGSCGLTYHGTSFSGKNRMLTPYYICGGKTKYRGPLQGKCTSRNILSIWLEEYVWKQCIEFIKNPHRAIEEMNSNGNNAKVSKESVMNELKLLIQMSSSKESEKQSIIELYRKKLINESDVEIQLQKITQEKTNLESRVQELSKTIKEKEEIVDYSAATEKFLLDLKNKVIDNDPPFELKRMVVRSIVREIIVYSNPDHDPNELDKKPFIHVKFAFSNASDNIRTVVLADIPVYPHRQIAAHAPLARSAVTAQNCQDRCSIGSICIQRCLRFNLRI